MTAVVLRADARNLPLPDASVDLIVTSVPYWGLRDYADGGVSLAGQIGSEATPQEWLANLVDCTREWVRVLKPEGSLFVNCGDKYDSGTTTGRVNPGTVKDGQCQDWHQGTPRVSLGRPKSLLGLPWRYALAVADQLSLILRAEIIWAKPNGLPESVTDRVRRSHEQLFHFTRQPRYYAAVDHIREDYSPNKPWGTNARAGLKNATATSALRGTAVASQQTGLRSGPPGAENPLGKLPGSVWNIPSRPLQVPAWLGIDHYAAFPMELPRRVVLGWSPPGVCVACGQGRRPVVDKQFMHEDRPGDYGRKRGLMDATRLGDDGRGSFGLHASPRGSSSATITGYVCGCPQPDAPTRPAIVLDPFAGTGTTLLAADALGRHAIGTDLSADYCRLARWRTSDPAERAKARQAPKPPPIPDGQEALFPL